MTTDTLLPPAQARTRYSPINPAPDAIRCRTPGCFRRRHRSDHRRDKLTTYCSACAGGGDRRPAGVPKPQSPRIGREVVLTRSLPADVFVGDESTRRCLDTGTACRMVSPAGPDGGAVLELACGGRFVCPTDAMRETGGGS